WCCGGAGAWLEWFGGFCRGLPSSIRLRHGSSRESRAGLSEAAGRFGGAVPLGLETLRKSRSRADGVGGLGGAIHIGSNRERCRVSAGRLRASENRSSGCA